MRVAEDFREDEDHVNCPFCGGPTIPINLTMLTGNLNQTLERCVKCSLTGPEHVLSKLTRRDETEHRDMIRSSK
jgi:hypothetical protein